jgi:hypothetical protein
MALSLIGAECDDERKRNWTRRTIIEAGNSLVAAGTRL